MASKQVKSQKMVDKAVSTFADAVNTIEAANQLLEEAIIEDENKVNKAKENIRFLEGEIVSYKNDIDAKYGEIQNNQVLISQLKNFVK